MSHVSEHSIPCTHPSLSGHFPGNPVVPGVILLEQVLNALQQWQPEARVKGFQAVKFLQPVKPDSRFTIALEQTTDGSISFMCQSGRELLNSGTVVLQPTHSRP